MCIRLALSRRADGAGENFHQDDPPVQILGDPVVPRLWCEKRILFPASVRTRAECSNGGSEGRAMVRWYHNILKEVVRSFGVQRADLGNVVEQ